MSRINRELVEYYLNYKLSQKNHPSPLQKSGNASLSSSVGSRDGSGGADTQALKATLRVMAHAWEEYFTKEYGEFTLWHLSTSNKLSFKMKMDYVYNNKISWGGIVALFVLGGTMCVHYVETNKSELVCHVADFMTAYLDKRLNPWIQSQGGWDDFTQKYRGRPLEDRPGPGRH